LEELRLSKKSWASLARKIRRLADEALDEDDLAEWERKLWWANRWEAKAQPDKKQTPTLPAVGE
jgi:hypothetical protein